MSAFRRAALGIWIIAAALPVTAHAGSGFCGVSDPVNIAAPATSIPDSAKRFSGIWVGEWRENGAGSVSLCSAIAVEEIRPNNTANVLYIVGDQPAWGNSKGAFRYGNATIDNGVLVLSGRTRVTKLRFEGDELVGESPSPRTGTMFMARFKKAEQ